VEVQAFGFKVCIVDIYKVAGVGGQSVPTGDIIGTVDGFVGGEILKVGQHTDAVCAAKRSENDRVGMVGLPLVAVCRYITDVGGVRHQVLELESG
jgi:hypothetical protein